MKIQPIYTRRAKTYAVIAVITPESGRPYFADVYGTVTVLDTESLTDAYTAALALPADPYSPGNSRTLADRVPQWNKVRRLALVALDKMVGLVPSDLIDCGTFCVRV